MKRRMIRNIRCFIGAIFQCLLYGAVGIMIGMLYAFIAYGAIPFVDYVPMADDASKVNKGIYSTIKPEVIDTNEEKWAIIAEPYIESLIHLKPGRWDKLEQKEKLNILQIIANIEATYLGLKTPVRVGTRFIGTDISGCYDNSKKTAYICIDRLEIQCPKESVKTLLHEMKHAYQHECVELLEKVGDYSGLLLFKDARTFSEGFEEYPYERDTPEQMIAYMRNATEVSARAYSMYYKDYFTLIEDW